MAHMNLKQWLRNATLDLLAQRDDRYYWRQPMTDFALPDQATLCLWQPDGKLGDSVIHTILVDNIVRQRPDVRLIVVCAASLLPFWARIPGVWQAVSAPYGRQAAQAVLALTSRVDVLVSLEAFASVDTLRFIQLVKAPINIGLSVGRFKAFQYSITDNTYDFPRRHVTDRLRHLCALMRLNYQANSALPNVAHSQRSKLVTLDHVQPCIFLNIYGAGAQKLFTDDTVAWLISQVHQHSPTAQVILNVPDPQRTAYAAHLQATADKRLSLAPKGMSLWELIALMQQCHAVITPDTGIGHIAGALGLPLTVFFEDAHYTPVVWAPVSKSLQIVAPTTSGNVNNFDRVEATARLGAMLDNDKAAAASYWTQPQARGVHGTC
jgi:ADP-heptose:LPS heptosyltransferase